MKKSGTDRQRLFPGALKYFGALVIILLITLIRGNAVHAGDPVLIAHRGYCAKAPENTTAAFRNAGKAGFKWIETDIYESSDGEFFIMHDPTVNRTTNGKGKIRSMKSGQLKKLRIDRGKGNPDKVVYRIPTLMQALAVCDVYKMTPVLHVREISNYSRFNTYCRQFSFYRNIIYMIDDPKTGKMIRKVNPKALIMAINYKEEDVAATVRKYKAAGALHFLNTHLSHLTQAQINTVRSRYVRSCGWFINNLETALVIYNKGCRLMVTDWITPAVWKKYFAAHTAPKVSVGALSSGAAKQLTVKWSGKSGAGGYEVSCAPDSNFFEASAVYVKKNSTKVTMKVKSGGRKYYVRIRSYRKAGNGYYFSDWSAARTIYVR